MEEDALLEGYELFLESLSPTIPPLEGADWHLRLVWMPSSRPERIHDVRCVKGEATVTLARCLKSAWEAYSVARANKAVLQTVPVETGTARLEADDPVLAVVEDRLPLRLTEPQRFGVDGETWAFEFRTTTLTVKTRAWSPEGRDWIRLIEAVHRERQRSSRAGTLTNTERKRARGSFLHERTTLLR